ncbi:MAG: undecaprenyl-diphosphate phosphatase [Thermoproteota archaeon]|nr:undecaprenyl-diphosphate phosphatase [Candidatus Brockarchaeota archaeon]
MLTTRYWPLFTVIFDLSINSLLYSNFSEIFLLSLVQGITEWFPISSSGHLVLFQEVFNIKVSATFDIMLHTGSLIGVVLFTRREIYAILKAFSKLDFNSSEGRMLTYLVFGTIPIVISSILLKEIIDIMFTNLLITGLAMLINGVILYLTKYSKPRGKLNIFKSMGIGVAQSFAIIPGISRMGITISTALISGLDFDEAYKFSLLLSILSITGGCVFKLKDFVFEEDSLSILLGVSITAIISILALRFLKKRLDRRSFYKFAYYSLAVGGIVLFLDILKPV